MSGVWCVRETTVVHSSHHHGIQSVNFPAQHHCYSFAPAHRYASIPSPGPSTSPVLWLLSSSLFLSHEKARHFSYQACWTSSTSPLLHSSRYSYACLCRESCFAHVCVKLEGASRTVNFEVWPYNVYIQLCTWSRVLGPCSAEEKFPPGFYPNGVATVPAVYISTHARRNVQVRGSVDIVSCSYCGCWKWGSSCNWKVYISRVGRCIIVFQQIPVVADSYCF